MARYKTVSYKVTDETTHQLIEIARLNGFTDPFGNPNRSQALRYSIARTAYQLGAAPYDPANPPPEKAPTKGKSSVKTHCPHGHEFTEANARVDKKGVRKCKACERIRAAKNYQSVKKKRPKKSPKRD